MRRVSIGPQPRGVGVCLVGLSIVVGALVPGCGGDSSAGTTPSGAAGSPSAGQGGTGGAAGGAGVAGGAAGGSGAGTSAGGTAAGGSGAGGTAAGGTAGGGASGASEITATLRDAVAAGALIEGVAVRAESSAGDVVESATGADGVVHLKVDPSKGPYDVTFVKLPYSVRSILGVTGPIGDVFIVNNQGPMGKLSFKMVGASSASNTALFGAFGVGPYTSSTFGTLNTTFLLGAPTIRAVGLEIDGATLVNGSLSPSVDEKATLTISVMLGQSSAKTTSTMTVAFPTTGLVTSAAIDAPGNPSGFGDVLPKVTAVVCQTDDLVTGRRVVGVGTATKPVGGTSTLVVESFGGDLAPDTVLAGYTLSNASFFLAAPLADGSTVSVPTLNTLVSTGTTLADLQFGGDAPGYDAFEVFLEDPSTGASWTIVAPGGKLASRSLPHLPSSVSASDLFAPGAKLKGNRQVATLPPGAGLGRATYADLIIYATDPVAIVP